jgi:hypothetical protein
MLLIDMILTFIYFFVLKMQKSNEEVHSWNSSSVGVVAPVFLRFKILIHLTLALCDSSNKQM